MASNRSGSPSSWHDHLDSKFIWVGATSLGTSNLFVYGIRHPLTLLCGLWAGLAWTGRHPKGLAILGSFAGLLDLVTNWSLGKLVWFWPTITAGDIVSTIGIAALFTAGGLFGDLIESWRSPRKTGEKSEFVRLVAEQVSGPEREPNETTLKLVQALGPSTLGLIGLILNIVT